MKLRKKKLTLKQVREKTIIRYFEENNYALSEGVNSFELNHSRYLLYKMFDYFYFNANNREYDYEKFKVALVSNKTAIDYLLRTVDYKYETSFEELNFEDKSIQSELSYISDRWYSYYGLLFLQKLANEWGN